MGARSYIANQVNQNIQKGLNAGLSAMSLLVDTQVKNNESHIANQIKNELDYNVYSNPNTDEWDKLSTDVFSKAEQSIDNLSISDEAKARLKNNVVSYSKAGYDATLETKIEQTKLYSLSNELNNSMELDASDDTKSLYDAYMGYSTSYNNANELALTHGLELTTPEDYLDILVPTKSKQYVSSLISNMPTNFIDDEGKLITPDSMYNEIVNQLSTEISKINANNELAAITGEDLQNVESLNQTNLANIKTLVTNAYNQKLGEVATNANNISTVIKGEISNNSGLYDTDNLITYFSNNFPDFIQSTIGQDLVDMANLKNDKLNIQAWGQEFGGYANIPIEKINSIKSPDLKSGIKESVAINKISGLINESKQGKYEFSSIDDIFTLLESNLNLSLTNEEKTQIVNELDLPESFSVFKKSPEGFNDDNNAFKKNKVIENEISNQEDKDNKGSNTDSKEEVEQIKSKTTLNNSVVELNEQNKTIEKLTDDSNNIINKNSTFIVTKTSNQDVLQTLNEKKNNIFVTEDEFMFDVYKYSDFLTEDDIEKLMERPKQVEAISGQVTNYIDDIYNTNFKDKSYSLSDERTIMNAIRKGAHELYLSNPPQTQEEFDILFSNINKLTKKETINTLNDSFQKVSNLISSEDFIKTLQNSKVDKILDQYQQGDLDFFIDSDMIDELANVGAFLGNNYSSVDSVKNYILEKKYSGEDFNNLNTLEQIQVESTATVVMAAKQEHSAINHYFNLNTSEMSRFGNRYAYKIDDEGVYAMVLNSKGDNTSSINMNGELSVLVFASTSDHGKADDASIANPHSRIIKLNADYITSSSSDKLNKDKNIASDKKEENNNRTIPTNPHSMFSPEQNKSINDKNIQNEINLINNKISQLKDIQSSINYAKYSRNGYVQQQNLIK